MKIVKIETTPFYEIPFRSSGPKGIIKSSVLPCYKVKVDKLPGSLSAFAAVSDLQGRELGEQNRLLGELVAEELALLSELNEIPHIDLFILAGDLYDYPDCRKMGGTGDVTGVFNAFARKFDRVAGVLGNHDIVEQEKLEHNAVLLNGTSTGKMGVNIGGVSGIIGNPKRNQRKEKEQFLKELQAVTTKKNEIVVLHQGPDGPEKGQPGEISIREFLEKEGASLILTGHCYWSNPLITIGKNQVLNVDNKLFLFT